MKASLLPDQRADNPVDSNRYFISVERFTARGIYKAENFVEPENAKEVYYVAFPQSLECVRNVQVIDVDAETIELKSQGWQSRFHSGLEFYRVNNKIYHMRQNFWQIAFLFNNSQIVDPNDKTAYFINPSSINSYFIESKRKIITILVKIWSFLANYSMFWSIISDILLCIDIYSNDDPKFLIIAITFIVAPLLITSWFLTCIQIVNSDDNKEMTNYNDNFSCVTKYCNEKYQTKGKNCLFILPIVNIPSFFWGFKHTEAIYVKYLFCFAQGYTHVLAKCCTTVL